MLGETHRFAVLSSDNPLPEADTSRSITGARASRFVLHAIVVAISGLHIPLHNACLAGDQRERWEED